MAKDTFFGMKKSLRLQGERKELDTPLIMGVLNVTPDSFYAGSRTQEEEAFLERAARMLEEGADILDIGGYSSRPGADHIPEKEERERCIPAIEGIRKQFPDARISVDTFRSAIAREAVEKGADIVNDISGGVLDEGMMDEVAELGVPYIMMHMPGTPQDMQERTDYEDVGAEVFRWLSERLRLAREKGIADPVLDPGFGFGKTLEQNYRLFNELESFSELDAPLLVGVSRKSMITRLLGIEAKEALNGSTVLNTLAVQRGADILRVHDVKEARELVKILKFEGNAGHFE